MKHRKRKSKWFDKFNQQLVTLNVKPIVRPNNKLDQQRLKQFNENNNNEIPK